MLQWTCLRVFECPAVGSPDAMVSVFERPLGNLALPSEAEAVAGETFYHLFSPERFDKGDRAIVCHDEHTVIGYTWLSFKDLWVSECHLFLSLAEDEAVTYDAFVFPQHRGRGLYAGIESAALAEARNHGRRRVITFVESRNVSSLKTQLRLGKTLAMSLYSIQFFNRFSLHWATGRPLASRFYK